MTYLLAGRIPILALLLSLAFLGCASMRPISRVEADRILGADPAPVKAPVHFETGVASFYGPGFHGRTTASGERYDQEELTAAHRTLAFGSRLKVTNLANGESVVVKVTDRGPYVRGRVIDLSVGAARALRFMHAGVARVRLQRIS